MYILPSKQQQQQKKPQQCLNLKQEDSLPID